MSQLQQFFSMGGYAAYVWPAYVITLTILFSNFVWTRQQTKKLFHRLKQEYRVNHES